MIDDTSRRSPRTWILLALLVAVAAVLAVVLTSGLSIADEAGQPLSVPAVSLTPEPSSPSATPTPTPTVGDGSPEVVYAPDPVTVDDHGGDSGGHGSDDGSNSGSSGSGSGPSGG